MTPTAEPAQGNHRATYREVLAEPRFRLLFSTRAVAITAGSLRITTFSVLVFATTGSPLLSALAFGIGFLPQLFGSLLLGSLADQLPPRALIADGYALECAAALLLALVRMPIAASLGGRLVLSAAALRLRIGLRSRPATAVPGRPAAGWPGPGLRLARVRQHDAAGRRAGLLRLGGRRHPGLGSASCCGPRTGS